MAELVILSMTIHKSNKDRCLPACVHRLEKLKPIF